MHLVLGCAHFNEYACYVMQRIKKVLTAREGGKRRDWVAGAFACVACFNSTNFSINWGSVCFPFPFVKDGKVDL